MTAPRVDPRRRDRELPEEEGRRFSREQRVAYVATTTEEGWPYVIPLTYVYEGGDRLWFYTRDRTGQGRGLFLACVRRDPRACQTIGEIGDLHPGRPYACNPALVYASVACFGTRDRRRGRGTQGPVLRSADQEARTTRRD